ncbi:MAG: GNAT family N-acetyltransferase [Oscillospiraceae bacterium]|nr:GNAT family N-acetyltransferase [Oscillospiraceae bacterium]
MEEIIRKARESDIPTLEKLWSECFPDDTEYAGFFFENIFKLSSARVCEIGGEVVAMIHVFPRTLKTPEGEMSAKYIYGVGTTKSFRGRGIAGRMLEDEARECDVLLLIPQSESLFAFYEKYGFDVIAKVKKEEIAPDGKAEISKATKADIPYLNEVYERELSESVFATRNEDTWRLLMSEYEFFGGGFLVFHGGYCAYYEHNGKPYIAELFSDSTTPSEIAGAFGRECTVITNGEETPLAVMRPVSESGKAVLMKYKERYINLMHN